MAVADIHLKLLNIDVLGALLHLYYNIISLQSILFFSLPKYIMHKSYSNVQYGLSYTMCCTVLRSVQSDRPTYVIIQTSKWIVTSRFIYDVNL